MEVREVMTKTVASLNTDDTIERAAELMKEYNVGSIPVCRGDKVVGIITDRDIALRSVAEGGNSRQELVKDIMTSNPVLGSSNMDIHEAARIMSERQIRRLPIVEKGNLVGIISLGDLAVEPQFHNEAGEALSDISIPSTPDI